MAAQTLHKIETHTTLDPQAAASIKPVELDPEILANLKNSISVQGDNIKAGKFGILYETICNAPIAITAGALAHSGLASDAINTASGLLITIPIYAAMGASIAIPVINRRNLLTAKKAYENTGDSAYIDLVSAHLADTLADQSVPHIRGEKRSAYKDRFNQNRPVSQKMPLSERVQRVFANLASLSKPEVWKNGTLHVAKSALNIAGTMAQDIRKLKKAPKDGIIMGATLSRYAYNGSKLLSSAPGYDIASIITREKELFSEGMRDLLKADSLQYLRDDVSSGVQLASRAFSGNAHTFHNYWDKITKREDEEIVLGHVETSENANIQVDKDHLDRTLHNIHVRNNQEKILIGLNLVGITFETAFVKKYLVDTIHKGGDTISTLQTSWSHAQEVGMPALSALKYSAENAGGDITQTLVAGISGVLMGTAAWHHMVKTFNASNRKLHDAASQWAETVEEQNKLNNDLQALQDSVNVILDPNITDGKQRENADVTIESLTGKITPSSLPKELKEQLKEAEKRNRTHNSSDDEFGFNFANGPE
jgi:hypothetical protein